MVWGKPLPLFPVHNEGISCQFTPALISYHSLISGSGLFPRIHSKVSLTGPGVLNPGTTGLWGQITLSNVYCPVHCRMFSSIPGRYPLDASSTFLPPPPPSVTTKNPSRHCQMFPRGQSPLVENCFLEHGSGGQQP